MIMQQQHTTGSDYIHDDVDGSAAAVAIMAPVPGSAVFLGGPDVCAGASEMLVTGPAHFGPPASAADLAEALLVVAQHETNSTLNQMRHHHHHHPSQSSLIGGSGNDVMLFDSYLGFPSAGVGVPDGRGVASLERTESQEAAVVAAAAAVVAELVATMDGIASDGMISSPAMNAATPIDQLVLQLDSDMDVDSLYNPNCSNPSDNAISNLTSADNSTNKEEPILLFDTSMWCYDQPTEDLLEDITGAAASVSAVATFADPAAPLVSVTPGTDVWVDDDGQLVVRRGIKKMQSSGAISDRTLVNDNEKPPDPPYLGPIFSSGSAFKREIFRSDDVASLMSNVSDSTTITDYDIRCKNQDDTATLADEEEELDDGDGDDEYDETKVTPIDPKFCDKDHHHSFFSCVRGKLMKKLSSVKSSRQPSQPKERPFTCDVCQRAFVRKHDLRRHESTHNAEAPIIKCDKCFTTFTRSDALQRHIKGRCRGPPQLVVPFQSLPVFFR